MKKLLLLLSLLFAAPALAQDFHGHGKPEFSFFARTQDSTGAWDPLFAFKFSRIDAVDLAPRWDDCVYGSGYWEDGDRIAYHTGYAFFAHQDPDHHDYLNVIRFMVQAYGSVPIQVNDRYMSERLGQPSNPEDPENSTWQGLPPYPYEQDATVAYDTTRPGGVIEVIHNRTTQYDQRLYHFEVPAVSETNPKVKFYYQLGGLFVVVHDDLGPIARIIVTSLNPNYAFRVLGVTTGGLKAAPDRKVNQLIESCPVPGS